MRDFFSYDKRDFAAACKKLPVPTLQEQEVSHARASLAHGAGTGAGVATTFATAGAALPLPIISARMLEISASKLKVTQLEIVDRCEQVHELTFSDWAKGLAAFGIGQVVAAPLDGVFTGSESGAVELVDVAAEVAKFIPGEIVTGAALKIADQYPPKGCRRRNRYKHLRLRCAECKKCFDTSYTEFLHCCDCNHQYDVCADCVPNLKHSTNHQLYRLKPECPKIPSSWRSTFGKRPKCDNCSQKMSSTDYYSCSDCSRRYNVCLHCYASGAWCHKHVEPLHRRQAKG